MPMGTPAPSASGKTGVKSWECKNRLYSIIIGLNAYISRQGVNLAYLQEQVGKIKNLNFRG